MRSPTDSPAPPARVQASRTNVYEAVTSALAGLAETRDPSAGDHLQRIRAYCREILRHLEHDEAPRGRSMTRFAQLVVDASTLHDIGKAAIPDSVLLKPGRLTPSETACMRGHTVAGYQTLSKVIRRVGADPYLTMSRDIALSHHERWDGGGYPQKLAGRRIPLSARIVAVADVFDALTSERCYKGAIPPAQAVQIVRDGAGTHFDPQVVNAFRRGERRMLNIATSFAGGASAVGSGNRD